jgi:hypothetical protein
MEVCEPQEANPELLLRIINSGSENEKILCYVYCPLFTPVR